MKLLVVASWYPGPANPTAGIFVKQQVEALSKLCDVAVVHVGYGESRLAAYVTQDNGVPVARAEVSSGPMGQIFDVRSAGLEAFELLRDQWGTPDIVHVQALWPAAGIALALKRRYGIPYVVTEHSEEYLAQSDRKLVKYRPVVRWLLRPLALGASRTIAVSRFLADRLVELGLAKGPVVVPNVVPECTPASTVSTGRKRIAHVSVMGPAKNLPALLEAVERLSRKRDDFELVLAGDGEMRVELERIAGDRQLLDGIVRFTGRIGLLDVQRLLADSAFTVVSSTHETFSVSAAESLMCGRPVLSTKCGGPEEFITPEVGRLIDAGSVDALVDGLDWMLDHYTEYDPQALHTYARERFSPDVVAHQIISVYQQVLDA